MFSAVLPAHDDQVSTPASNRKDVTQAGKELVEHELSAETQYILDEYKADKPIEPLYARKLHRAHLKKSFESNTQTSLRRCFKNVIGTWNMPTSPRMRYSIRHVDMNDDVLRRQSYDGVCSLGFLTVPPFSTAEHSPALERRAGLLDNLVVSAPTKINIQVVASDWRERGVHS